MFTCKPLGPPLWLTYLAQATAKCDEDPSCRIFEEYKLWKGNNDYSFCPPITTIEKTSSTDGTLYVKDMKGNIL